MGLEGYQLFSLERTQLGSKLITDLRAIERDFIGRK